MKKKILGFVLVLVMLTAFMPCIYAATILNSGACGAQGNNLTWTLDSNGTLIISGNGDMADYMLDAPWYDNIYEIKTVIIKNGVTSIGECAFYGARWLTEIKMPDTLKSIGDNAFNACGFTALEIPESVTSLGVAFYHCNLKSITVPGNIKTIREGTFNGCLSLTDVTISNGVINIEKAFDRTELTNITIPESVETIADGTFSYNNSLKNISVSPLNKNYKSAEEVLFTKDGKELLRCPPKKEGTAYKIPDTVKAIGSNAFAACSFKNIIIPNSLTEIKGGAFSNCRQLTNVTIPRGVTIIGSSAFRFCGSLTDIKIPDSVTEIGNEAFQDSGLKSINIPNSVIEIGEMAFYDCENLQNATLGNGITTLPRSVFVGCINLENIIIPDSVTSIEDYAFCDCNKLKMVVIPAHITKIGYAAFFCSSLSDIYYKGSKKQWENIDIDRNTGMDDTGEYEISNEPLFNANIYYGYTENCFEISDNTVTNTDNAPHTARIIIAAYRGNTLQNVTSQDIKFASGQSKTFTIPQGGKIFVWDSLSGMKPLIK